MKKSHNDSRPSKWRSVAAAFLAVCAFSVFTASSALAHDEHTDQYGHKANGCTAVNDYVFHDPCDQHDWCYDSPTTENSEAGRLGCDNKFLDDMRWACVVNYPVSPRYPRSYVSRQLCYGVATVYYNGVRRAAGWYFQNPDLN